MDAFPDNCVDVPNSGQDDSDGDGVGDVCEGTVTVCPGDVDCDGFFDASGNCPNIANDQTDSDGDNVGNACDNCVDMWNTPQVDYDQDNIGDACDTDGCLDDVDCDTILDTTDNCPNDANPLQADCDYDSLGDACDLFSPCSADSDGDGVVDAQDLCPGGDDTIDSDGDSVPDACDAYPNDITQWSNATGISMTVPPATAPADSGLGFTIDVDAAAPEGDRAIF